MKYFCRIQLDAQHAGARDAVAQTYCDGAHGDHQFLWQFFAAPEGAPRDFIFRRIDPSGDRQQPLFYCVSNRPAAAPHPAWRVQCREYCPELHEGDRLQFDLRVNPTQAHEREGKSRRDDVVMHAKKLITSEHGVARWAGVPEKARPGLYEFVGKAVGDWLRGADARPGIAARHGFRVQDDLRVDAYRQHRLPRQGKDDIRLSTVDLTGTLEVVDAARFTHALLEGIGHAKAFGCGLLLVRRVN